MTRKIIVQAGGRGSRMRHHTWNKPKCLIPYQGQPILYHLFDLFPNDEFYIITDYLSDVIDSYLSFNVPAVKFKLIQAHEKGTSSGIQDALKDIDETSNIVIVWSDLVLPKSLPDLCFEEPTLYFCDEFICRWNVQDDGTLVEDSQSKNGLCGLFSFPNKSFLSDLPNSGEFVRYLSHSTSKFRFQKIQHVREIGDFQSLEKVHSDDTFCRFFNQVSFVDSKVVKRCTNKEYDYVHQREVAWYEEARRLRFFNIPNVENYSPLTMEKIDGQHAYQMKDTPLATKRLILNNYFSALEKMHSLEVGEAKQEDMRRVYFDKTRFRVFDVAEIIPNFSSESMTVNGIKVRNIFHKKHDQVLEHAFDLIVVNPFGFIHGDPTFSNSLIDAQSDVMFIDPRGYFSDQSDSFLGDTSYDFSKLYYSAIGGYDLFNQKQFKLYIDDSTVEIFQQDSVFKEEALRQFQERFSADALKSIQIIHGLIWLSLTGYSKDDIDQIIAAFYLGLYYLELALED